jgi:hypothetical protein
MKGTPIELRFYTYQFVCIGQVGYLSLLTAEQTTRRRSSVWFKPGLAVTPTPRHSFKHSAAAGGTARIFGLARNGQQRRATIWRAGYRINLESTEDRYLSRAPGSQLLGGFLVGIEITCALCTASLDWLVSLLLSHSTAQHQAPRFQQKSFRAVKSALWRRRRRLMVKILLFQALVLHCFRIKPVAMPRSLS